MDTFGRRTSGAKTDLSTSKSLAYLMDTLAPTLAGAMSKFPIDAGMRRMKLQPLARRAAAR